MERQRADEELARRIRNEIRRVQSGQADEQMAQEAEQEREQEEELRSAEERKKSKRSTLFWQLFSGNILVNRNVADNYPYLV